MSSIHTTPSASLSDITEVPASSRRSLVVAGSAGAWLELTKPRLSLLVVATAAVGYAMGVGGSTGAQAPGIVPPPASTPISWLGGLALTLGTAAVAAAANVFNHLLEVRQDSLMERTWGRPLPSGRLRPGWVVVFGLALGLGGTGVLAAGCNGLTAALGVVTLLLYVGVYTPLKRRTSLCTLVGAVVGGLPPAMGQVAALGAWRVEAWALFGILFIWQIPHFLAIAWIYRDDYRAGGFRMLPCADRAGRLTANIVVLYLLALVPTSLALGVTGRVGWFYFAGALTAGLAYLGSGLLFHRHPSREAARRLFLASLAYLPAVMMSLLIDRFVFIP